MNPAGQANMEMENDWAVTAGGVRPAKCEKLIFMLRINRWGVPGQYNGWVDGST